MLFRMNESLLKKSLKYYLSFSFLLVFIIPALVYTVLLRTIYQQASSLTIYSYIIVAVITIIGAISVFIDCVKVENGQSIRLGVIFVLKALSASILVTIVAYPIYIFEGTMTVFEILNIRLIMVIFLMAMTSSMAAMVFNFFTYPLYKKYGTREYSLPMIYSFLPISLSTVVFIITLISGIYYRSELKFYERYSISYQKDTTADFSNLLRDKIDYYVNIVENLSEFLPIIRQSSTTFDNYLESLSSYLLSRYSNDRNIKSFSIYVNDTKNRYIDIGDKTINNIYFDLLRDDNEYFLTVSTNYNIAPFRDKITRLNSATNSIVYLERNASSFFIYYPLIYNNVNVGFVSMEANSDIYNELLQNDKYGRDLNIFLIDDSYTINAYNNPSALRNMQRLLSDYGVSDIIRNNNNTTYINNINDTKIIRNDSENLLFIKYFIYENLYVLTSWSYVDPLNTNQSFRSTVIGTSLTIYLGLAIYLIVLLLLIFTNRKTIVSIKNVAESLSEKDGDLTIRLPISSNSEAGELACSFNIFLDKLQDIILSIKNNAYTLTGNIKNLRSSINTSISDFETMNIEFKNEIDYSNKIADSSSNAARVSFMQRTRIASVNEIILSLLDNINNITDKMKDQSEAVNKTTSSVQEMMANIVTVSHGSSKANNYAKTLNEEAREGSDIGEMVVDSIQSIKEYSKQIINITQVIQNIAEQTNLLAMNAAIEAAHAGIHGKGFAVVADKIRKLAEDTGENSKIINDIIEETTQAIDNTVALAFRSASSLDKILDGSNTLAELISTISDANDELDVGRREILNNISNLNSITEYVQELSIKQKQMSSTVSNNIYGVDKLAEDVVEVVNNTESKIKTLVDSIENVTSLSNTNINNMETMDTRIKELQYIFLQLYKLVVSFKTEKVIEDIDSPTVIKKEKTPSVKKNKFKFKFGNKKSNQ